MLKLFNVLSRRKEIFKPLRRDQVGLYTCGPTVYNFAHIGNLRTYIFEDVLRRTLEYVGYKVQHVMNITDIDDKIIRDAKKSGKSIFEFVKPYEKAFFNDIKKLNIKPAWKYPRATKHIREMVIIIQNLLKKGLAYKAGESVYFDISKFKKYGRLSRIYRHLHHRSGKDNPSFVFSRIDVDEYSKDNVQDFVLWKGKKSGEPSWRTPFGQGRPGWHIECSAMSMKYLGPTFDIHAGGVDLIFPHHENEIAQSEGATDKTFARFFVEGEHLLVNGKKMSKSLGNIFTLRDIEKHQINPLAFRYLVLSAHYRSKLNFTWKSLEAAQNSLKRLYETVTLLKEDRTSVRDFTSAAPRYFDYRRRFVEAIANDLDTPKALTIVWSIIHDYHRNPSRHNSKEVLRLLYDFDKVFGLGLKDVKSAKTPKRILKLVKKREEYRKKKLWQEADEIRRKIQSYGYSLEDTPVGPKVKKNN